MTVLLITYDLNKPEQDYPELLNIIKSHDYFFVSKSSYLVDVVDPSKLWEKISTVIDESTRLCMFPVERSTIVRVFPESSETKKFDDWLHARIH